MLINMVACILSILGDVFLNILCQELENVTMLEVSLHDAARTCVNARRYVYNVHPYQGLLCGKSLTKSVVTLFSSYEAFFISSRYCDYYVGMTQVQNGVLYIRYRGAHT